MLGESQIVLAGGHENMSQVPYSVWNIRFGTRLGESPKVKPYSFLIFKKNKRITINFYIQK